MEINMSNDLNEQQEELFPPKIRCIATAVFGVLSLAIISYFIAYIFGCVKVSPKDLSLSSLLIFSLLCVLLFSVPWNKLGLSLKKFGPLEFEKKLEGQSNEHIQDISALEDKISRIETIINQNNVKSDVVSNSSEEQEMRALIIQFLTEYQQYSFSPLRMENWGAKKKGYSKLKGNPQLLRRLLRKLVAEDLLDTRLSAKGNTLYRIND